MVKTYYAELVKGQTYLINGQKFIKGKKQEVAIDVYKALKANDSFLVTDEGEVDPKEAFKFNDNEKGKTPDFNYEKDGTPKDPDASDIDPEEEGDGVEGGEEDELFTEEELQNDYDLDELKSLAETFEVSYASNITKATLIKKILEAQGE